MTTTGLGPFRQYAGVLPREGHAGPKELGHRDTQGRPKIYHNFIRPHEGLNGETPAEKAGIKVEGHNKWLTLIQNAKHAQESK
jgi:hypothetical protein